MSEIPNGPEFSPNSDSAEQSTEEVDLIKTHYDALIAAGCTPEEAMKLVDSILGDYL